VRAIAYIMLVLLAACGGTADQVELTGNALGTQFSVKLPTGTGEQDPAKLQELIEAVLARIDAQMSTYRPDSEINRFNTSQSIDWQPISAELCRDIERAQAISLLTDGAFDITVAPLVDLWGFGPGAMIDTPPDDESISALLAVTGFDKLHVDCDRPALKKDIPDLMVDLSAVGKGVAADRVGFTLDTLGYESYLVEIGGELAIRGSNADGVPWAIGIEAPLPDQRRPHVIVHLTESGMATSGDYRNFFEADGKIYSHTIDTRTGRPVTHNLASVTVIDEVAYRADALATALLVMGPEEGLAFAEREELAVLMLIRKSADIEEQESAAFSRLRGTT
jgi:thiamine biosynthesis lipoprotein